MQIFRPVADMAEFRLAVGNAAQADQRQAVDLANAQHRIGFHVDHIGIDGFVGAARDHIGAGGKPRFGNARNAQRQFEDRRQVEKRRAALLEAERRGVHIAIGHAGDLIDFRMLQRRRAGRPQGHHEIGQIVRRLQARQFARQVDGGLDRADAGQERREPRFQESAVFGLHRHDEQDRFSRDTLEFVGRHPAIPSRPRTTIIVPVIEATSLAGPSRSA